MKKFLVISLLAFGVFKPKVQACDVCNIFEYRPLNTNNYIGLFYHYRKFNGYNDLNQSNSFFGSRGPQMHELDGSNLFFEKRKQDYERYQTLAVRFNYRLFDHWNLLVIAPYETVEVHYSRVWSVIEPVSDTTMQLSGLGDITTAIDRVFTFTSGNRKHIVRPGIAFKWATGNAYRRDENGVLYDPEIQTGSGSNDFMVRLNYLNLATQQGLGYAVAANYKWNSVGAQDYKFGNSWNAQFNLMHVFQNTKNKTNYIPKLGLYAEGSLKNSRNGELVNYTGGQATFLNVGMDFQHKSWSAQVLYQQPVYQSRNGNQIGNAGRLNLVLLRSF